MALTNRRKRALRREAFLYTGKLVYEVVNTYEAFGDLPDDERAFIDEYIRDIGERLNAQAKRYTPVVTPPTRPERGPR